MWQGQGAFMLSWLVDNAVVIYLVCAIAGLGLLAGWLKTRRREFLIGLGAVAAVAGLVLILSFLIVTDRKQIERNLQALAAGMKERPPQETIPYISKQFSGTFKRRGSEEKWNYKNICDNATRASQMFNIEDIIIREIQFTSLEGSEAVVLFDARPVMDQPVPSFFPCEARFVKEDDGVWRMSSLKIFDPQEGPPKLYNIPF
jgi:hypothetical protein